MEYGHKLTDRSKKLVWVVVGLVYWQKLFNFILKVA
jgi:hypothetical protein